MVTKIRHIHAFYLVGTYIATKKRTWEREIYTAYGVIATRTNGIATVTMGLLSHRKKNNVYTQSTGLEKRGGLFSIGRNIQHRLEKGKQRWINFGCHLEMYYTQKSPRCRWRGFIRGRGNFEKKIQNTNARVHVSCPAKKTRSCVLLKSPPKGNTKIPQSELDLSLCHTSPFNPKPGQARGDERGQLCEFGSLRSIRVVLARVSKRHTEILGAPFALSYPLLHSCDIFFPPRPPPTLDTFTTTTKRRVDDRTASALSTLFLTTGTFLLPPTCSPSLPFSVQHTTFSFSFF